MKKLLDKISDETMVGILFLICLSVFIGFVVVNDMNEAKETQSFITQINEYQNEDHKYYCEVAESREASMEYLISNNCK